MTFNAPVALDRPEDATINTAIALLDVARAHVFGVCVGLASGKHVTGIIGNTSRQSFTAYGEVVNLAPRLEGKCKELRTANLIDQKT